MTSHNLELSVHEQSWPLDKPFRISRGSRMEARVIVVTVSDGHCSGRGEAVPSKRYGETVASATSQLEQINGQNIDRQKIQKMLPAGAARNALDCALWDLEAKHSNKRAWELANLQVVDQVVTAFTISLDTPEAMGSAAKDSACAPLLKLKLGGDALDLPRVKAVRKQAPAARLIVDANESWSAQHYSEIAPDLQRLGVELIEQPFPEAADDVLQKLEHPVPVCADESCHTTADLPRLAGRYQVVNIKLDKTGGLTEALILAETARQNGFKIFIGCMVCTSLGIAPARLLASTADFVDLDGPLLLAGDRHHGLPYHDCRLGMPPRELWG